MKPSCGIRPTPRGSSASTSSASVARHTGEWLASVSATQVWLLVQAGEQADDLSAQRWPPAALGSETQYCVLEQASLQGGGGRASASTSPTTFQSFLVKGCVRVA